MAKDDRGCREFEASTWSRRDLLTVGALSGMGLALPELLRAREEGPRPSAKRIESSTFGRARSVIVLYLHGGHPQHETWDPKPDAPAEVRGDFKDIATSVPGTRFCELFPMAASLADKFTVIRSLTHNNSNHVQASMPAMTGHSHPAGTESQGDIPPSSTDFPPFGAVLDHLRSRGDIPVHLRKDNLPTWVQVGPLMRRANGTVLHGQRPGFLGPEHSAFAVNEDLLSLDVKVQAVTPQLPVLRMRARQSLLAQVDSQQRALGAAAETENLDHYYQRAFQILTSPATANAFRLAEEPHAMREQYGMTQFGQSCLLARRLAEASVPMVNVHFCHKPRGSWDTHRENSKRMRKLAPNLDRPFTALVTDLEQRGLLDETLVVATAEFGRTPTINQYGGRDHWPWVYSVAFAGAGTRPGVVYGSSDRLAAYPNTPPHDPRDFAATLYHLLGVPRGTTISDGEEARPVVIGEKIDAVLAG